MTQFFKHLFSAFAIYRSSRWDKVIQTYIKGINPTIELIEWSTEDPTKNIFVHFNRSANETQIKLKVSGRENQFLVSLDSRIAIIDQETELIIRDSTILFKRFKYSIVKKVANSK